mmetsp:Transcript_99328/g.285323  ORF Transcript_99328/g.285323 Transcript_99328/m.285323 type:complete len:80 (-) Transcript_99328:398-637(-)
MTRMPEMTGAYDPRTKPDKAAVAVRLLRAAHAPIAKEIATGSSAPPKVAAERAAVRMGISACEAGAAADEAPGRRRRRR